MSRLNLYFKTLIHVKPKQLYFQLYYRLRNRFIKMNFSGQFASVHQIAFEFSLINAKSFFGDGSFEFLNKRKEFDAIDWNFSDYGKLWTYNLNYFDFLQQEEMTREKGLELMRDYVQQSVNLKDGHEPYPISLRGINWVKFLSKNSIESVEIQTKLYQDFQRLSKNLEFHLLANHLLENGFSLLFGAYYFRDKKFYSSAKSILTSELEEQILQDGAHYELSPMYHQIILHRVLDCYNLVQSNNWKHDEIKELLRTTAEKMLSWLEEISFANGEIPMLNDSTHGIAPVTSDLIHYAKQLGLNWTKNGLSDSGYRKLAGKDFELVVDVGQIAPSYQPGHSHADNLNIVLHHKNQPIIVDRGISTYEKNNARQEERSSFSHNTVVVNDINSSEVWSGFRVGKRAKTTILSQSDKHVTASHNGYRKMGCEITREIHCLDHQLLIKENIKGQGIDCLKMEGHLHLHPDVICQKNSDSFVLNSDVSIQFNNCPEVRMESYAFCEGFNKTKMATKLIYTLTKDCSVQINFQPE